MKEHAKEPPRMGGHRARTPPSAMAHSPITSYHEQLLHSAKQKAENYIESYKNGETLFDIPLSAVVEQQYDIYKDACQNLGGISQEPEQENTP